MEWPSSKHSPSSIVNNILNDPPYVSVLLCEIQIPQLGRRLVVVRVGFEDPARLSLGPDDSLRGQLYALQKIFSTSELYGPIGMMGERRAGRKKGDLHPWSGR